MTEYGFEFYESYKKNKIKRENEKLKRKNEEDWTTAFISGGLIAGVIMFVGFCLYNAK